MANGTLQTLDRGIEVLLLVARTPEGMKISDLVLRLGLHRAAAYRIVTTLVDHAVLRRTDDGRVVLGAGAFVLGAHATDTLRDLAQPVLQALAECTCATAFLSMAQGLDCVVALTAEPRDAFFNISYRVGTRHPIDRGAAGIAILATRPEHADDSDDIRFARAHGYSITRSQLQKGAVGVSSPVILPGSRSAGTEYSVGVVALENLDLELAAEAVPTAARALSQRFG